MGYRLCRDVKASACSSGHTVQVLGGRGSKEASHDLQSSERRKTEAGVDLGDRASHPRKIRGVKAKKLRSRASPCSLFFAQSTARARLDQCIRTANRPSEPVDQA